MYEYVFYYANLFFPANDYPRLKNYSMLSLGYIDNMYIPVHGLDCQIFTPIGRNAQLSKKYQKDCLIFLRF